MDEETALQTFSPREVQARVRGGESAELIAAETGWPLDKVLRYAEPLLAERSYIAEQAQAVEVRRSGGGATLLEAACAATGSDPESIAWDAWRRDDGRWIVTAIYRDGRGEHRGHWTYDPAGRNLHALDDDARTLMGARPVAVPDSDVDIAEALDLVRDVAVVREEAVDVRPRLVAVPDTHDEEGAEEDEVAMESDVLVTEILEVTVEEIDVLTPEDAVGELTLDFARTDTGAATPHPATAEPGKAARKAKGKRGRASVPTWDEILFGATKRED